MTKLKQDEDIFVNRLSAGLEDDLRTGVFRGPGFPDACRILLELGFEDRSVVKTALRTVYARSRDEQLRFDRIFDRPLSDNSH